MEKSFPYLEVRGSHREVGLAIGETFRDKISSRIALRKRFIKNYNRLLEKTRPYFTAAVREFPQYIDEMKGIASGANIPLVDYFFLNTPEVYPDIEEGNTLPSAERCTTIVSRTSGGYIIGHNEDAYPFEIDDLFILKATIGGTTFLCLDYASYLSGSAASINSHGLVQCINNLNNKPSTGVPVYFAARAVLACRTLTEAAELLRRPIWASGFNHVLIQGNSLMDVEICSKAIDVSAVKTNTYIHTNHYLSDEIRAHETSRSASSVERYKRACSLVKNNMTVSQIKSVLSDAKNKEFPINRPEETIAAVIIEPNKRTISCCRGRPNEGKFISYTL